MNTKTLQRNNIIWHKDPKDNHVTVGIRQGQGFLSLSDFQAWLWLRLSNPYSVDKLRQFIRGHKEYYNLSDKLNKTIRELVDRKVLKYIDNKPSHRKSNNPQKYQDLYTSILQELNTAKNFKGSENLNIYHRNSIVATERHFEAKEVTISHIYRQPHIALGGLSYGAKLYHKINSIKKITKATRILEIGGGLGYLARSFVNEYRKNNNSKKDLEYICCDLAFKFIESQRDLNINTNMKYCQGNAERMPFKNNNIDLIIANENIADFTPIRLSRNMVLNYLDGKINLNTIENDLIRRSLEWIRFASIDVRDATPDFIFNIGAVEFINEIKRVLKKEGLAFITEYGKMRDYPIASNQGGHAEYSIQFRHLIKIIKALGMDVQVTKLLDFLEFKKDAEVINPFALHFICYLLKQRDIKLPFLAYTRGMLKQKIPRLIKRINNLPFFRIADRRYALSPDKFYVLLIRKKGNKNGRLLQN
jgi:ubiquinone/menaquinone biosynthesis C-methylase UbiE